MHINNYHYCFASTAELTDFPSTIYGTGKRESMEHTIVIFFLSIYNDDNEAAEHVFDSLKFLIILQNKKINHPY